MTTTLLAMPDILDPMYWLGEGGLFASAVLPGILIIVFIETGLLFPLLPGDSLLFTGGLLAAAPNPPVNIWALVFTVPIVAILGDQVAYFIGRRIGPALFDKEDSRFFKKSYVTQSHAFFEKHGPKTIILARFVPIVRTFAPVLAGVSYMSYRLFLSYNIVGGILWGAGVTTVGYFLGNVPFVKHNLELVILLIVFLSILPGITAVGRSLLERRRARPKGD
ncbi:MAG TPA: VTT domain-containing protein [Mycobacterium sp.]|nr:MAG: DedA family protein [Mycobacterium sp.]HOB49107.1 VTT domain-containing protein [Mycobacterium sp.]HPZ94818.1 VTT domain-containing protein [Mycobacterium sp.]HQE16000.1 VTT domain-containing protein [Mycobacterium sp.]